MSLYKPTERELLAFWVRNDLAAAGVPISPDLGTDYRIGAVVEVVEGTDSDAGVWIRWQAHPHLRIAAVQLVAKHRHEGARAPIVKHAHAVGQAMCGAMLAILVSAGYEAIHSENEYRPLELKVISGPAESLLPETEL